MTESTNDDICDMLERAMADSPEPHTWDDVERRAAEPNSHSSSRRRTGLWLAAAACLIALIAGLAVVIGSGDDTIVPSDDDVPTSPAPETTSTTAAPGTSVNPVVEPEPETTPVSTRDDQPPGSPAVFPGPVSGQAQQTVVGNITWTLLEGDSSTLPTTVAAQSESTFFAVDGAFFAIDERGTWRSPDGISWELTDLDPGSVVGVFEFGGETWAKLRSPDGPGLGRWDGEMFVPVDLPELSVPDVAGLQASSGDWFPRPVEFGDQLVVPVATQLSVPWHELVSGNVLAEWDPVTETISLWDWESDGSIPVAVFEVEPVQGDPGLFDFRNADTGETLTTVGTIPGVDPDEFLMRLLQSDSFTYYDFLVSDGDDFEIVETPWDFADHVNVTALDGRLLSVVSYYDPGSDSTEWELSESSDARTWTPLELPTPVGSQIDSVSIASDGSLALLTIMSRDGQAQPTETWSSVDATNWTPVDVPGNQHGGPGETDFGWLTLTTNFYELGGINVSADGLVWQEIPFNIGSGTIVSVRGQTIFVTDREDDNDHTMWVGRVEES